MPSGRRQQQFTDDAINVLNAAMHLTNAQIQEQTQRMLANVSVWAVDQLDAELQKLFALMNDAEAIFIASATSSIPGAFRETSMLVTRELSNRGLTRLTSSIDLNAVQTLLRDASIRYQSSNQLGQHAARTFFNAFSKQSRLTESEISEHLAAGLISKQDARESMRILNRNLADRGPEVFDEMKRAKFSSDRLAAFRKRLAANGNLSDALRAAHLARKQKSLEAGRVLQLIDKNGDVRTYETRTYAELVARTKIADAQVSGTIETGTQFGVQTFRVTSHNTETEICVPHENQIYTTAPKTSRLGRIFPQLDAGNKPAYHPNCRHRLLAYPLLDEELDRYAA